VNRSDFQELVELHLQHTQALLDAKLYSGAYYMCGYVVECALKACICKRTNQFDFFPRPEVVRNAYTHESAPLIRAAGLTEEIATERRNDRQLDVNWKLVVDWSEGDRYELHREHEAVDLYHAVADPDHGVLACIKRYW
jgi:hypothetical protein